MCAINEQLEKEAFKAETLQLALSTLIVLGAPKDPAQVSQGTIICFLALALAPQAQYKTLILVESFFMKEHMRGAHS